MSGYRNSGLTEQEFEDREALKRAIEVIGRLWAGRTVTKGSLAIMAVEIEEGSDGR
jgi:hypothetical protein